MGASNRFDSNRTTHGEVTPPRFSVEFMDREVDPTQDFYSYAVGGWVRRQKLPEDKAIWGAFAELGEYNMELLRRIVEEAASDVGSPPGGPSRLVGDFYSSGMNVDLIERLGFKPISDDLNMINAVGDLSGLIRAVAKLHMVGVQGLFNTFSRADRKNSGVYALYIYQGGLSLPDREYYLADRFGEVRERFREHVARVFGLAGVDADEARRRSGVVLDIECTLARISRSRVELRDQEKNYNRVGWDNLVSEYPNTHWDVYLGVSGVPRVEYVVVGQPEYIRALDGELAGRPLEDWKTYLTWHLLHASAPFMHSAIVEEDFEFFHRVLLGQLKPEPRWKRVTRLTDELMGEALGQLYVQRHFPREARERVQVLIEDIKAVLRDRIANSSWMSDDTKRRALVKLDRLTYKIGHPEQFRDYSSVQIIKEDFLGNIRRLNTFERQRQYRRVGQAVDRGEWMMSPPTVNAYYSPTNNEIVLPSGILQPPFFDVEMDDAVNYGGIGSVIGHELTHGFDDQGRRFDAEGNLTDWWTPEDEERFRQRAQRVVEVYSALEALPQARVNGELTLGENIADLGGLRIAYDALQRRLAAEPEKRRLIDGLTPEQRFFISYAQIWRQVIREQELKRRLTVDPHSPGKFRGTIPVVTHPDFPKVFNTVRLPKLADTIKEDISVW